MILVDDDDDDDEHNAEDDDGGMSQFQWFDEQFHSESVNLVGTKLIVLKLMNWSNFYFFQLYFLTVHLLKVMW